jgi:hypothetical protein
MKSKGLPKSMFHKAGVYKDLKDAIAYSGGDVRLGKARMAAQELGQKLHKQQRGTDEK